MERDFKSLNKRKKELVKEIKLLEKKKTAIKNEEYEKKRHDLERELVEVCDRLVQYGFVLKGGM
ncbi:MAG: hypothetical protein ACTSRW_09300 [Candidatus Helarchaeota archaeon]